MKKYLIFGLVATMLFSVSVVLAQEPEIAAEDLDVEEPGPFSWLGDIARDIQIFFTFDPIKKSELQLKKSSRQLIRARNMVREDPDDTKLQAILEKIDGKYQGLIEKINARVEGVKVENPEAPELKNFLDKYTDHQLLHFQILGSLEEKVPEQAMEIIRQNREDHLEKFGEVMNLLQSKEEFKERLETGLENEGQRIEQRVKRMEILEELGEVAPAVKERINEMKQEKKELFQELEAKRQEIRENIQLRTQEEVQVRTQEEAQVRTQEEAQVKTQEETQERTQEGIQEGTQERTEETNRAGQ